MTTKILATISCVLLLAHVAFADPAIEERVNSVESAQGGIAGRVNVLEAEQVIQNSRLDAVEATNVAQDADILSLDADVVGHEGRIATLEGAPPGFQPMQFEDANGVFIGDLLDSDGTFATVIRGLSLIEFTPTAYRRGNVGSPVGLVFENTDCTGQAWRNVGSVGISKGFPSRVIGLDPIDPDGLYVMRNEVALIDESVPMQSIWNGSPGSIVCQPWSGWALNDIFLVRVDRVTFEFPFGAIPAP